MVYFVRLVKSGNSMVVTLPAPVRDALLLGHGDQLALTVEGDSIRLVKMSDRMVQKLVERPTDAKA